MSDAMAEARQAGANLWQGRRVRLRGIEPADWAFFHEWNLDSETARRLYFVPFPVSAEWQRRWAERMATADPADDRFQFVIETLGGDPVGSISAQDSDPRQGTFSFGVAVQQERRRHGYAAEAILLLLRYFFRERRYQKATSHVFSFNTASVRLHERLGFTLEGRIRRMVYTEGQYFDDLIFGLTAEEFSARYTDDLAAR
jgi:RimJ/RimL family protein N-acetyltransferase